MWDVFSKQFNLLLKDKFKQEHFSCIRKSTWFWLLMETLGRKCFENDFVVMPILLKKKKIKACEWSQEPNFPPHHFQIHLLVVMLFTTRLKPLTKSVPVCRHRGHGGPDFADGVVALHHVGRLEPIPPSDHVELVVYDRHAELQPPSVHHPHLDPRVGPQVVLLHGGGAFDSHRETRTQTHTTFVCAQFKRSCCVFWPSLAMRCTFGGVHPSHSVEGAHRGLPGFGPGALEHWPSLWQEVVLHGLHQQLLAFKVVGEHLVVFQISKKLNKSRREGK